MCSVKYDVLLITPDWKQETMVAILKNYNLQVHRNPLEIAMFAGDKHLDSLTFPFNVRLRAFRDMYVHAIIAVNYFVFMHPSSHSLVVLEVSERLKEMFHFFHIHLYVLMMGD